MANNIRIGSLGHPITEDLSTVTVGGKRTSLELSSVGNGCRVQGDLEVSGNIKGNILYSDLTLDDIICDDITCDDLTASGSAVTLQNMALTLDSEIQQITVEDWIHVFTDEGFKIYDKTDETIVFNFDIDDQFFAIYDDANQSDLFKIQLAADGVTTISTVDADTAVAHLTLDVDGFLKLDAHAYAENEGVQFLLAGTRVGDITGHHTATNFRLYENIGASTNDYFNIAAGANGSTIIKTLDAAGADAHMIFQVDGHIKFDDCAVGFEKVAATFGVSGVIGDANDSTDIDFRLGNKAELELTDNLGGAEKLNLIFPATSGNFILVLSQDGTGSRTVHADSWTAYQSDGSTEATNAAFANGTDGDLRWAGGSAPTLTTTADKQDIVSIYWDADNQTAFAVVSQNF